MNAAIQLAKEAKNAVVVADTFSDIRGETIKVEAEEIKTQSHSFLTLGKSYRQARDTFPLYNTTGGDRRPPGWYNWIKENLKLNHRQVNAYICAYDACEKNPKLKNSGVEVLAILGSSQTPESAVEEVSELIEKGKKVTKQFARDIVKDHKAFPTPSEANKIARDENRVVAGSDGKYHTGLSDAETDEYRRRRRQTYGIMEAIESLADCDVDGDGWIKQAKDHWISDFRPASIDEAIKFLEDLKGSLYEKKEIIDAQ